MEKAHIKLAIIILLSDQFYGYRPVLACLMRDIFEQFHHGTEHMNYWHVLNIRAIPVSYKIGVL